MRSLCLFVCVWGSLSMYVYVYMSVWVSMDDCLRSTSLSVCWGGEGVFVCVYKWVSIYVGECLFLCVSRCVESLCLFWGKGVHVCMCMYGHLYVCVRVYLSVYGCVSVCVCVWFCF